MSSYPSSDLLAPILQAIAGFLQENIAWLLPLAGAVVVVVGAIKLWNMWQMILNGTLVLNPIGLVIAAVVALIAVVILVVKNWDKIVSFLKTAFGTRSRTTAVDRVRCDRPTSSPGFGTGIKEGSRRVERDQSSSGCGTGSERA